MVARRYYLPVLILVSMASMSARAAPDSYCQNGNGAAAVDLSQHVTQTFLKAMKNIGIKTIIRYYDQKAETLPGKTLHAAERQMIVADGFNIGVVFQHWNNRFSSFTTERGRQDAERALVLAEENNQTKGSAIYFGVDGPWSEPAELQKIKEYFTSVNEIMRSKDYRVGVYGSGLICETLIDGDLAALCWLANAKGWPNYRKYYDSRGWVLAQTLPIKCGGVDGVDFNVANEGFGNFGQFGN